MLTALRRLFWLALLGGAGYAAWTAWQRSRETPAPAAPNWPAFDPAPTRAAGAPTPGEPVPDEQPPDEPVSGEPATDGPVPDEPVGPAIAGQTDAAEPGDAADWVAPIDGACPVSHPIKANDNSGIYHRPGGRFYDRTVPERCYATPEAAERDGYRAAKS